jgi:transcriptional regulator with XRE-family HTH domain
MAKLKKEKNPGPANTFGGRVKAIRKSLKMRQEDFVLGLKISTTHLSEIELDKSKPGHDFFYNIVKNYHVNLYYLLFGEGEMFGGVNEAIVTDGKKIKTGDKNIDLFLYYFFNSPMVHSYLMYHFRKIYGESNEAIKKDIENSVEDKKITF